MMNIDRISGIDSLSEVSRYGSTTDTEMKVSGQETFDSILSSAMKLVGETDQLSNQAEEEEIRFAIGETDNWHDLMVAQQKANISLQYTVAVKNAVIEAYKSLINMQF